jgi:hypothetical protein
VDASLPSRLQKWLEQEPQRLLRDEGVIGLNAVAVLEALGRGAERPSEIASRLGTAQTNLSRLLHQLLDVSILTRELPFGESVRSTKRTLFGPGRARPGGPAPTARGRSQVASPDGCGAEDCPPPA